MRAEKSEFPAKQINVDNFIANEGEQLVASALTRAFPSAPQFSNLIVPTWDGLTELDHTVVLPTGIFVIETKHYRGEITGKPDGAQWVQNLDGSKIQFANPLHQNARHVRALHRQINCRAEQIHSVIAFVGSVSLTAPIAPNVITTAAPCLEVAQYIRGFQRTVLARPEIERFTSRIRALQAARYSRDELLDSLHDRHAGHGKNSNKRIHSSFQQNSEQGREVQQQRSGQVGSSGGDRAWSVFQQLYRWL